jgi:hypothetical protein
MLRLGQSEAATVGKCRTALQVSGDERIQTIVIASPDLIRGKQSSCANWIASSLRSSQ